MDKINIITYNVLSSNLADLMQDEQKDNKKVYPADIMDNNVRWKKVSAFIKDKIKQKLSNLVFCLQEVSEDWLILFATLFTTSILNVQELSECFMNIALFYLLKILIKTE